MGTVLNCVLNKLSDERPRLEAGAAFEVTVKVEIGTAIASPDEGLQTGAVNRGTSLPGCAHSSQQLIGVSSRTFVSDERNKGVLAKGYLAVIRGIEAFELRTIALGWPRQHSHSCHDRKEKEIRPHFGIAWMMTGEASWYFPKDESFQGQRTISDKR
jgi:hypothetical protein